MADISKITLPDGNSYDIKDAKKSGIYAVKGTQTAKTGAFTGVIDIPSLYDGLTIAYYLPYAGNGNATLNLTLSDGTTTGAIPIYYTGTSRLTTHYGAGSTIILTCWDVGTSSVKWTRCDYNTNTDTKVRQTISTGNTNRPLLMAYSANTVTTDNVDNVSYRNNSIYANPSTGLITATNFANSNGTIGASYDSSTETITIVL